MSKYYKYPRTYHMPLSEGRTSDDKTLSKLEFNEMFKNEEVVCTIKMDGENSSLYNDHIHARSLDSKDHESRHWLKSFHSGIKYLIPENIRICGENLFAKHSISYNNLKSYFYGFSVWEKERCYSWDESIKVFENLGIETVPIIYRGVYYDDLVKDMVNKLNFKEDEGFVIRKTKSFTLDEFRKNVAKYVRKNHVQTDSHWMHQSIESNKLKNK